eukprot:Nitzschia sp. Nitz4//scaffold71_size96697//36516//40329//NITZ4_004692-RA/size96697-augustus-gene-0.153-mRNA-1//-1//CDS//3329557238//2439//frame0
MSTMLKSAAMSLLSKTLQTFLYKYLRDVDVEGVALPSVYDGSGWGVRLSNVRLREGVQLMHQVPGSLTKKRKKRRKRKVRKSPSTVSLGGGGASARPSRPLQQGTSKQASSSSLSSLPLKGGRKEPVSASAPAPPAVPNGFDDTSLEQSLHFDPAGQLQPTRSRASSTDDLEVPLDDHADYYSNDDGNGSDGRPSTPLQDSKSIFSCFSNSKHVSKPPSMPNLGSTEKEVAQGELALDGHDSFYDAANDKDPSFSGGGLETPAVPVETVQTKGSLHPQVSALHDQDDQRAPDLNHADTEKEDMDNDEDEWEEYEQPYRLCLGEHGRIGTLDIRLVDKELHVRVEDAVLTIEAYPVADLEEGDEVDSDDEGNFDDTASTVSNTTQKSTKSKAAAAAATNKKAKASTNPSRATVGDRVLADNPLARAIAAIPHLFLRDIKIRLIIRKESPSTYKAKQRKNGEGEKGEAGGAQPQQFGDEYGPDDTMLEIGIDFLSVSNGEDALSHFQKEEETETSTNTDGRVQVASVTTTVDPQASTPTRDNEFMVRHIRTGRGPSAGIWVQVFSPSPNLPAKLNQHMDPGVCWARQQWISEAEFHLLRCSGLDVRARIHMATRKEIAANSWFYDYDEDGSRSDFDESTLDSMLLGIDNVVPGPQFPPQPPSESKINRGDEPSPMKTRRPRDSGFPTGPPSLYPGAGMYTIDENEIQSCDIPSTFHRIARGATPGSCKDCHHLPSETCPMCWDVSRGIPKTSPLDHSTPMPGLVFQFSIRDPLEINVDRSTVETLGLLKTLFVKKKSENHDDDDQVKTDLKNAKGLPVPVTDAAKPKGMFASLLSTKTKDTDNDVPVNAFPSFCQPESIQIAGIHVAELSLRVHVLKEEERDMGLAFCYWDIGLECLTLDHQTLKTDKLLSQDLDFGIGRVTWEEITGVDRKQLLSLGSMPLEEKPDLALLILHPNVEATLSQVPWPSTASVLLDTPPSPETEKFKSREHHGLLFRYIVVNHPSASATDVGKMSTANVRLGMTSIDAPWGFWRDVRSVKERIVCGIVGKPPVPQPPKTNTNGDNVPLPKSVLHYSIQIDSGSISMSPVMKLSMPLTRVSGERSPESGMFVETILNKLSFEYGKQVPSEQKQLSLQQLAELPENVRLRILMFLKDWKPLEEALEVKKLTNPFKRTRAVNKGIMRMAKKQSKMKTKLYPVPDTSKRQTILTEMRKLDDKELSELWALHQRQKRRNAKRNVIERH